MGILLNRLLIMMNDSDMDSTDYHIAFVLLMNFNSICKMSIGEVAKLCNVSKSTISKFIRDIHFEDYAEFKAVAPFQENKYRFKLNYNQNIAEYIEKVGYEKYLESVQADMASLNDSLTKNSVRKLAEYLVSYKKVASFGLLFSEAGAIDLQMKLAYNGKFILTNMNDVKQDRFIKQADEGTLVIIYSNSGSYIDRYQLSEFQEKKDYSKTRAKICIITGNEEIKNHPAVDLCISFKHNSIIQTHTEIYPLINDRIVMEYRKITR